MSFRELIDPNWTQNLPRPPQDFIGKPMTALDDSLPIVDRLLEPQTMAHFLEYALSGDLPTGGKTSLPRLPGEIITNYLMVPYANWAPGPHDIFGLSPFDHVMVRIGSHQDGGRLVILEKGVHAMKSRLWESIMPMSENRWRQKRLDDPANHHLVCRHLGHVIEVFSYLQCPPVQWNLTETFRLIRQHFSDFDQVFNGLPERQGKEKVRLAALWEEFMTEHYTAMATHAHSWVVSKCQKLRDRDEGLIAAMHPPAQDGITDEQMAILNRFHDFSELAVRADYTIFVHMPDSDPPATGPAPNIEQRRQQYANAIRQRSRRKVIEDAVRNLGRGTLPMNSSTSLLATARAQREEQDGVRQEFRGPARPLPPVYWITKVKKQMTCRKDKRWGFAAYRLTYGQTDEDWAEFLKKLNADLNDWGDGEDGIADIKDMAQIHWLDGNELGFTEGDSEAAKKHFKELHREDNNDVDQDEEEEEEEEVDEDTKPWYDSDFFLIIDSASFSSYMHGSPFTSLLLPGDTGGFVTVVDAGFDPKERGEHADESPHYPGQLRMLGNLVYSDLYAMLMAQTQDPVEFWPLAMNHPELVYTGPTIKAQVERWKKTNAMKFKLFEILTQNLRSER